MRFRLSVGLLFGSILAIHISYAQKVTSDIVVVGASVNDGYGGWTTCGVDGQVYRRPGSGRLTSIMRVSRDGSTSLFALPDGLRPQVFAPAGTGLNILASHFSRTEGPIFEMYHFDSQANLLAQHPVLIDFGPSEMAITTSGVTIVVGHHPDDFANRDDWKYGGAVLDADDKVITRFELPLSPGGGGWTFVGPRMAAGDGVAYVILHSEAGPKPATALATISESGHIDIKILPVPPDSDKHHHNEWLFGPGVAVEEYHYLRATGGRPRAVSGFDEYDLTLGKRVATKTALPSGFQSGCYLGDEFSMLAHSAHVDPARHLLPEALRLVTVKLQ